MIVPTDTTIETLIFLGGEVSIPSWLFWLLIAMVVILALILWSARHRRDPTFDIDPQAGFRDVCDSITGLTHGRCTSGNSAEILQDQSYFERINEEIANAKHSINFETYLWSEGKVSDRLTRSLSESAKRGVDVRVMLDGSGGSITDEQKKDLEAAGARFAFYHPFGITNLGRINNRDHRKIMIVDGKVGFVGGHCITDYWWEAQNGKPPFRDISVRLEGPVVHELQSTFSENWIEETGDVFLGQEYFPTNESHGEVEAHVARITPNGTSSAVKLLHYLVIVASSDRIRIQNPYFLPDPDGIEAMKKAVDRGVDIQVMVPSAEATDNALVQHAGHHRFGAMLEAGIRIFEYEKTLLHQKVIAVDGIWCGIGSTNFDDRSFELNDEITVGFWDEKMAKQLEETFERDLEHCVERKADSWKKRGIGHKLIDGTFFLINEQL